MKLRILVIIALCIISCRGVRQEAIIPVNKSLNDSLVFYLSSLKDIPNPINNPTTTFIHAFERNDSTIITFDSQPENERSLIPGIDCGLEIKDTRHYSGNILDKPVFITIESNCIPRFINKNRIRRFSKAEREKYREMKTASCNGWRKGKYYRQYFLSETGDVVLLESINP